jgi:deferrochelatase/peroxidase EfeB
VNAPSLSRRSFIGRAGAAGAGAALAGTGLAACGDDGPTHTTRSASAIIAAQTVPFRGAHQAGIVTPVQDRLVFASFDVVTDDPDQLADLLARWTEAAESLTSGRLMPGGMSSPEVPPADTGEAYGLPPAELTVTIGYGPTLFDRRFGLTDKKPAALAPLPRFPLDDIQPAISGGDLCLQACANDPLVAYNAIHNLTRAGIGVVSVRMMQTGFGRTSSTSTSQATARNLMGFKDGTRNLKLEQPALVDSWVWSKGSGDQRWMQGGSYLVARKIRMLVETWDVETLAGQEAVFGRAKDTGAPLGEDSEFATPDLDAQHSGRPLIADDAHIRLASPEHNGGVHLLRRGYNYSDGVDPTQGNFASGLFFIAFTSDPDHFTKVQRSLAHGDALNEYIEHISSAVFACPRGLADGETWRDQLFP